MQLGDTSSSTVVGDWNDLVAAAGSGASKAEMAVLSREELPGRYEFRIQTLGGEGGLLTAEPVGEPDPERAGPIRLTARIGTFRNQKAEARLLASVAERLRRLAGVRTAPIPGP